MSWPPRWAASATLASTFVISLAGAITFMLLSIQQHGSIPRLGLQVSRSVQWAGSHSSSSTAPLLGELLAANVASMPLQRLTPLVKRHELGTLRLWQDDLTEIVRLVRQLPNVEVRIEADNNLLTDVPADLPQIGQRLNYFTVTATREGNDKLHPQDVITVKLSKGNCFIEATEPDLMTLGLIESIKSLVADRRRISPRLLPLYQTLVDIPSGAGTSAAPLAAAVIMLSLVFGGIFGVGAGQHILHPHAKSYVSWPTSIIVAILALLVLSSVCLGWARARTLLFTGTREEAPTFLQRRGPDIAINVIVGLAFYLLGLLTAHL